MWLLKPEQILRDDGVTVVLHRRYTCYGSRHAGSKCEQRVDAAVHWEK